MFRFIWLWGSAIELHENRFVVGRKSIVPSISRTTQNIWSDFDSDEQMSAQTRIVVESSNDFDIDFIYISVIYHFHLALHKFGLRSRLNGHDFFQIVTLRFFLDTLQELSALLVQTFECVASGRDR